MTHHEELAKKLDYELQYTAPEARILKIATYFRAIEFQARKEGTDEGREECARQLEQQAAEVPQNAQAQQYWGKWGPALLRSYGATDVPGEVTKAIRFRAAVPPRPDPTIALVDHLSAIGVWEPGDLLGSVKRLVEKEREALRETVKSTARDIYMNRSGLSQTGTLDLLVKTVCSRGATPETATDPIVEAAKALAVRALPYGGTGYDVETTRLFEQLVAAVEKGGAK